jgi:hypothetical protein
VVALSAFIVFAFASQIALVAFFATYGRRPDLSTVAGRVVYALGVVAAALAIALAVDGQPWYLVVALGLYAAWSALGTWIDIVHPIGWRVPPRWSIFIPYVALLTAAQIGMWMSLWYVDLRLWIAFGILYAIHTTLNVSSHVGAGRTGRRPT